MNTQEAIEILEQHQLWRRGLPPYDRIGEPIPSTGTDLGKAIAHAIEVMGREIVDYTGWKEQPKIPQEWAHLRDRIVAYYDRADKLLDEDNAQQAARELQGLLGYAVSHINAHSINKAAPEKIDGLKEALSRNLWFETGNEQVTGDECHTATADREKVEKTATLYEQLSNGDK